MHQRPTAGPAREELGLLPTGPTAVGDPLQLADGVPLATQSGQLALGEALLAQQAASLVGVRLDPLDPP